MKAFFGHQVDLEPASLRVGGGAGVNQPGEAVQRTFEVLYLDERARVVRFLPEAGSDSQPQLFVFERIAEGEGEEEDGEEGDEDDEEEVGVLPFCRIAQCMRRPWPRMLQRWHRLSVNHRLL